MEYDAVVVGGGPIGSKVAGIIAKSGFSVLILEEHREIGRPVQCSGLVSRKVLELSGTGKRSVIRGLKKARIVSSGAELVIESERERVFVINRSVFDREMVRNAIKDGSDVMLGTRVENFSRSGGGVEIAVNSGGNAARIKASLVIGADGLYSVTARSFRLEGPAEILGAFQAHVTDEVDEVRVFPEPENSFFSWQIPLSKGSLIGSAAIGGKKPYEILKNRFRDFERKSIAIYSGGIPVGYSKKTVDNNVMLVGDAASQVKPLSGGGLYPGLVSAEICGEVAVKALRNEDCNKKSLLEYQRKWQSGVGKEIKNGLHLRKIYRSLKRRDLDKILKALNNRKSLSIIGSMGNIDHPSAIAGPLVKSSPKLLVFARYLSGLLV